MSDSTSERKKCKDCGDEFPLTAEYFYRASGGRYWDSYCKKCAYKRKKKRREENREYWLEYHKQYYRDNREIILKQQKEYYQENRDNILEYAAKYRKENAETIEEYQRNYAIENSEKIKEYQSVYRQENAETIAAYKKEWYKENKEKIAQRYREWSKGKRKHLRAYQRTWYKENRAKVAKLQKATIARRSARKNSLPDNFTVQDWEYALDYFNGCCAVCGRQLNDLFGTHTASADHWIPLSYEGDDNPGTVPGNIVPLCHGEDGCNNSKGAKMPNEWLSEKYTKSKVDKILKAIHEFFRTTQDNI